MFVKCSRKVLRDFVKMQNSDIYQGTYIHPNIFSILSIAQVYIHTYNFGVCSRQYYLVIFSKVCGSISNVRFVLIPKHIRYIRAYTGRWTKRADGLIKPADFTFLCPPQGIGSCLLELQVVRFVSSSQYRLTKKIRKHVK